MIEVTVGSITFLAAGLKMDLLWSYFQIEEDMF